MWRMEKVIHSDKENIKNDRQFILQSLEAERVAVFFRIAVALLGIIITSLLGGDIRPAAVRAVYSGCVVLIIEALIIAAIVYRKRANLTQIRVMQYLTSIFEIFVVSIALYSFGGYNTFKSHIFQVYYVFIGLAALRYSRTLTLFNGLLAAIQYTGIFFYYIATDAVVIGTLQEEYLGPVISVVGVVIKITFLVLVSVLLSLTAKGYAQVVNTVRTEERKNERERNQSLNLRNILRRYFTKDVAEYIMQRGDDLTGEKREVSVLFCDFRDFTKISETMPTEKVFATLNHYLTKMVDIVFEYGGTLDKYTGDGFMAVFGAPLQRHDDTLNAVRAAIEIKKQIKVINEAKGADIGQDIQIGIGISTGEVVAGNIGSKKRMDYTVIGSVVNLASRIEHLNKRLSTTVLISEHTYKKIQSAVNANHLGKFRIRGMETPTTIYEVSNITSNPREHLENSSTI